MDRFHKIAVKLKLPMHNKSDIWLDIMINVIYCLQTVFRYIQSNLDNRTNPVIEKSI
jgi:hypothetical protein